MDKNDVYLDGVNYVDHIMKPDGEDAVLEGPPLTDAQGHASNGRDAPEVRSQQERAEPPGYGRYSSMMYLTYILVKVYISWADHTYLEGIMLIWGNSFTVHSRECP